MSTLPEPTRGTAQAIHLLHAVKAAAEEDRAYLGWSEIGHSCERYLWLKFRWTEREVLEGRIARLFDTGHREEARILAELRALGCKVHDRDENGQQFGISSVGGHLRGHLDAVVEGLPEAPRTAHLVDVKTISSKRFKEIIKKSMKNVYPKYWAQAHGYMGHMKLERAAFIFVCKDDDQIHVERLEFDPEAFTQYEARGERIIRSAEPPPRIADSADDEECKYCVFAPLCHGTTAPRVNCRTCAHSTPVLDGEGGAWRCELRSQQIGDRLQRTGCDDHRVIPILLERFATPVDSDGTSVTYRMADGKTFVNGPKPGFSSAEIRAAVHKQTLTDLQVAELREQFPDSRVVA
jgi:hypothetical protein